MSDACLFVKKVSGNTFALILVYVDDLILACTSRALIDEITGKIKERFRISSDGPLDNSLGIKITTEADSGGALLSMSEYIEKMFKRFKLAPK